jgi:hypothetical protein
MWRVQSNIPHNLWPRSAMFYNTSLHFLYIFTLEIFVHNHTVLSCNFLTVNIVNKEAALNFVWLAISTAGAANRNPEGVSSNNLCLPLEFVSNHENIPCGINPSKHVARVVVVIMTEALGESFSLDEIRNKCDWECGCSSCLRGKAKGEIFDRAKAG